MIQATEIQKLYVNLYKELREYLWPIRVVETITDLEVACYQQFPILTNIRLCFRRLKLEVYPDICNVKEYEELKKAFDKFEKFLDDNEHDVVYSKIKVLEEVGS